MFMLDTDSPVDEDPCQTWKKNGYHKNLREDLHIIEMAGIKKICR